jgi:hypothetical protein
MTRKNSLIRGNVGPVWGLFIAGAVGEYYGQKVVYRSFGIGVGIAVVLYKIFINYVGL